MSAKLRPLTLLLTASLFAAASASANEPASATADTAPAADTTPAADAAPAEAATDHAATAKRDAKAAMESWLNLIEEGKFIENWRASSKAFQQSVGGPSRWAMTCRNQRKPTGNLVGRTLKEEHYHTEFFDPRGHLVRGEMVTFIFQTEFQYLPEAREIVILCPFEGEWQVVSYSLKPVVKKKTAGKASAGTP